MFTWLDVKLREISLLSSERCAGRAGGQGSDEELPTSGFNTGVREVEEEEDSVEEEEEDSVEDTCRWRLEDEEMDGGRKMQWLFSCWLMQQFTQENNFPFRLHSDVCLISFPLGAPVLSLNPALIVCVMAEMRICLRSSNFSSLAL